jgi:hypothetical protein
LPGKASIISLLLVVFLEAIEENVENQGLCPTFKWRRNLHSFYRAGVSSKKHESIIDRKNRSRENALVA